MNHHMPTLHIAAATDAPSAPAPPVPPAFPAPANDAVQSKPQQLRQLIEGSELGFLMEAHNGLSARLAQEAGFRAIWASGLSMSAALGVRDSNEASWTQVLEILEFMSDATTIPILVDGDTGYGNFNNMRRLVQKLEQRSIGGVCIEDKLFPKTNSFLNGTAQPLADIDEFAGRIKAGKDAQQSDDFVIVARVEAFIAGWGLDEALKRAHAYADAGADAILMHSAKRTPDEVLSFARAWGNRLPVVLVPTKYYATPTDEFRRHGIAAVIWANHLLRSCITAMKQTADTIFREQSLISVEDRVAPISEVFRLQGTDELTEAEKRYLPQNVRDTRAIILGAMHGPEFGELTRDRPKCMLDVAGKPVLAHVVEAYRKAGIRDIAVVRGYQKEAVNLEGVRYCDNDREPEPTEGYSLYEARHEIHGPCILSYGDVLFRKYIPQGLADANADLVVMVDTNWRESRNRNRYADYVTCSQPSGRESFCHHVTLRDVAGTLAPGEIHGEWMGFLKLSERGAHAVRQVLEDWYGNDGPALSPAPARDMAALMRELLARGEEIRVIYTTGNWLDIDRVEDVLEASSFQ